jgi:hypothetical protein
MVALYPDAIGKLSNLGLVFGSWPLYKEALAWD